MQTLQFARPARRPSLIGLTPLIDVVFILLLFFMLATSFQQWRHLDLSPAREGAQSTTTAQDPLTLTVFADRLTFQDRTVSLDEVAAKVKRGKRELIIASDQAVVLQRLITVLDALRNQGIDPMLRIEP